MLSRTTHHRHRQARNLSGSVRKGDLVESCFPPLAQAPLYSFGKLRRVVFVLLCPDLERRVLRQSGQVLAERLPESPSSRESRSREAVKTCIAVEASRVFFIAMSPTKCPTSETAIWFKPGRRYLLAVLAKLRLYFHLLFSNDLRSRTRSPYRYLRMPQTVIWSSSLSSTTR